MRFKPNGPENNNKLYKNSREKDGNVKQACLKDKKKFSIQRSRF